MDTAALNIWWQAKLAEVEPVLAGAGIDSLWWSLAIGSPGVVQDAADIDQAIKVIVASPYGCDPHRPDFASDIWRYIDYPVPRAGPHVVREAVLAIELWEPRVTLDSVNTTPGPGIAGLTVEASWTIGNASGLTEVAIG